MSLMQCQMHSVSAFVHFFTGVFWNEVFLESLGVNDLISTS